MSDLLSPKQLEFIIDSTAKWNIAHGSVRSGKTVGTLFRFLQAVDACPDSDIWMVGYSADTIYQNAIRLIFDSPQFAIFRPFCTWVGGNRPKLTYKNKTIGTLGASNEGAIGSFQGKTFSLCYCDEMTLYPESIIDMIDTRLSKPHSMGFASMNPSHPEHKIKKWIDAANEGNSDYYALHFSLDDNPFVDDDYKRRVRNSLSGVFYKRNYLGLWCLAEGAIFDFFDKNVHVKKTPPRAAEYWIAGIDVGTVNPFCCLLIGVSTGRYTQTGKCMWVEKEYYYDPKVHGRQKTNAEFVKDVTDFLEPYAVRNIYIDPSAAAMQLDLQRKGLHVVHANNDVEFGISLMTSQMQQGNLFILDCCKNTIKEIESYVWDFKKSKRGEDAPMKQNDHACIIGESIISTLNGDFSIKDLVGKSGLLYSYCITSKTVEVDEFYNVCLTREDAEIWEIQLENGLNLQATCDHFIFTNRGWIMIKDLMMDDEILALQD